MLPSRTGVYWTMCCWAKMKAEGLLSLPGDVTSGDIAEPESTVAEEKKPAAKQAKAVAAAVAEKVNQESM